MGSCFVSAGHFLTLTFPLQEIMVGPQFQADLNVLHLNRHCDKSKWFRRPCGVLFRVPGNKWHLLLAARGWTSPFLVQLWGNDPGPLVPTALCLY